MNIKEFLKECRQQNKLKDLTGIEINGYFYNIYHIDNTVIDEDLDNETVIYAYELDDIDNCTFIKYEFTMAELEKQEMDIRFTYDKYVYSDETFLNYDIN